jgi:hypothetical protein
VPHPRRHQGSWSISDTRQYNSLSFLILFTYALEPRVWILPSKARAVLLLLPHLCHTGASAPPHPRRRPAPATNPHHPSATPSFLTAPRGHTRAVRSAVEVKMVRYSAGGVNETKSAKVSVMRW